LAHYHLARVLENEGRNDAAIEEHKAAAALDVNLAEPLYSLGLLYRRGGQMAEAASAMAEYKRRKALPPDAP
jgi:tetratricopeptide (TPR) repeat protein